MRRPRRVGSAEHGDSLQGALYLHLIRKTESERLNPALCL
jgi:hypothetical protein